MISVCSIMPHNSSPRRWQTVARERKQLREEKIQLGYWMADQFQKLGTMELRNKAVELLGARNYLLYVLEKKYAITDEDRDLITSLI